MTLKTLPFLAESEKKNQALTAENKKLKEELEKLKAQ
jgi:cell division protein FtsB